MIQIQFDRQTCGACGERSSCTRAASGPQVLKLRPQAQHEALQAARARQETEEFKQRYQRRAGIEGTISQGTYGFDLRYARYRGLAKSTATCVGCLGTQPCPFGCLVGRATESSDSTVTLYGCAQTCR